jgi:penicillin-binding protein 1A
LIHPAGRSRQGNAGSFHSRGLRPCRNLFVKAGKARKLLNFLGWLGAVAAIVALVAVIVGVRIFRQYEKRAAEFDLAKVNEVPQRSAVYDVNGELYSYLHGENRIVVPLESVSGWFVQSLLAREDSRFWQHEGLDFKGIARAAWTNFQRGGKAQGASTLTQQLARNSFELTGRTYDRKALEAMIARRIERQFSKSQILELYLNRIYFGSGFYGIETAARGYFGKHASELTLGESALLAGLIRSPNKLSPARNFDAALVERDAVLDRMLEEWMLTPEQAAAAKAARITLAREPAMRFEHDYVMDAVTRQLAEMLDPSLAEQGGLRIHTTIDPELQRIAQEAADRRLAEIEQTKGFPHPRKADFQPQTTQEGHETPTDYLQAAVVAVDNRNGAIRAIVGGRDFSHSKYNRALMSQRQVGSTFKSFIYAAAFQRGMLPGSLVDDSRIEPGEIRTISNNKWSPENSDGSYAGLQPASFGLLKSRNTMTVRIGEAIGLPAIRRIAHDLDIGASVPDYPVAFLGAFETTLKDITAAYTVFPNGGTYRPPYIISRVEDDKGQVLYSANHQERRVFSADSAWMTSSILQQVMKTGTAAKAGQLGWKKPGAGKTGTTNDFHDAWFIGYTTSLTCGVWVGMDKPQTIMEKGYGSALALPVWVDFMQRAPEKTYPARPFEPPITLVAARLCALSGARATSACESEKHSYEMKVPTTRLPGQLCPLHPEPLPPPPAYAAQAPAYPAAAVVAAPAATTVLAGASPTVGRDSNAQIAPMTTITPGQGGPRPPVAVATPAQRPVSIDFNAGPGSEPTRVKVERTPQGLRIYRYSSDAREPVTEPRVARAIPVEPPTERRAQRTRQGVRVYRAEPVIRERFAVPPRRVVRVVPEDEDFD